MTSDDETPSFKLAENQMESALRELHGASDETIRLARAAFRQWSAIRRARALARRGQFAEATSILEAELGSNDPLASASPVGGVKQE
jgi:hypothetical protein